MAGAAVTVTLDVTPPQITFGEPVRVGPDRRVAVPYSLTEPEVLEATVRGEVATVQPDRLIGGPFDQGGTFPVVALVRDDVWNEALLAADLVIAPWFPAWEPQARGTDGAGIAYSDRVEVA